MHLIATIFFALALSIDGLGVGVAYGIKNIKIPVCSLILMCCCAMLAIMSSMGLGHALALYFNPQIANKIGALALLSVGLWFISDALFSQEARASDNEKPIVTTIKLKPFKIIIQILREPANADLDMSGAIGFKEALFLGTALALDGLGAGIAASMANFNIYLTMALVGLCEFMMVKLGLNFGVKLQDNSFKKYTGIVSGCVMCLLGLMRLR